MDKINDFLGGVKDFMIDNSDHAILWIVLFFGGILVFFLTYNALNKNK